MGWDKHWSPITLIQYFDLTMLEYIRMMFVLTIKLHVKLLLIPINLEKANFPKHKLYCWTCLLKEIRHKTKSTIFVMYILIRVSHSSFPLFNIQMALWWSLTWRPASVRIIRPPWCSSWSECMASKTRPSCSTYWRLDSCLTWKPRHLWTRLVNENSHFFIHKHTRDHLSPSNQ